MVVSCYALTRDQSENFCGWDGCIAGRTMPCRFVLLLFALFFSFVRTSFSQATDFEKACGAIVSQQGNDSVRLKSLFRLDWDYTMHEDPETATENGYPGENNRWGDQSLEAIARRKRELAAPLNALESIERSKLNTGDQLSFDLFRRNLTNAIAGTKFPEEYMPITQLNGVQQDVARTLEIAPHTTVRDYEDMIERMKAVPGLIDQNIVLLQKGMEAGITPPRITLRDVPQQITNEMIADPERNPMFQPFLHFPPGISPGEQRRLREEAAQVLTAQVNPAFGRLYDFFVKTYLPGARETIGLSQMPDGTNWYAFRIAASTTTSMTPKQIHELGLSEVKRIGKEMDEAMTQTGFKGTKAEFFQYLRTDPQFFYTNAESLLTGYRDIAKRADPQLASLFGKLPRLPYGVREVPSYDAPSQTTAYYEPGAPRTDRPAWFMANTFALNTRPKWEMEALTLHESVPGHHVQIALAQEMEDVPEFRKEHDYTAFVEGWALYAESLGTEMGFYHDPYMKYGRLTYEMWRAIRLVVDTGIHSMGWSRQQAIDYFLENTGKSEHDVTVEVDRYIVWPGQALAYKIGELKIKELRADAARELGSAFDIREFHDQVLDQGAMPLDLLQKRIKEWVVAKKAAAWR